MKIALIAHGVADQALLGGPGPVAIEQAKALVARGHEVRIVTTDLVWKGRRAKLPTFDLVRPFGASVEYSKAWSLRWWPGSVGPIISPGSRALIRHAVDWADLIHAHEWSYATVQLARRLSQRTGKPFVAQPHGSIQHRDPGWNNLMHRGFNVAHRVAPDEVFIALSHAESVEIAETLGRSPRIHELVNPMPSVLVSESEEKRLERRAGWGCPPDARLLLYAHRLAPNKGLDIAIAALPHLPATTYLVVVGPDSVAPAFTAECRSLSARLGVESRVRFMGPAPRREMTDIINTCDVFVLPARRDTFPMSVLQALACGRPTVITDTCQIAEAVSGAVLVSTPDPVAFAQSISSLDEAESTRLGAAAKRLVLERFSPEVVGESLEAIYEETINTFASRARPRARTRALVAGRRLTDRLVVGAVGESGERGRRSFRPYRGPPADSGPGMMHVRRGADEVDDPLRAVEDLIVVGHRRHVSVRPLLDDQSNRIDHDA